MYRFDVFDLCQTSASHWAVHGHQVNCREQLQLDCRVFKREKKGWIEWTARLRHLFWYARKVQPNRVSESSIWCFFLFQLFNVCIDLRNFEGPKNFHKKADKFFNSTIQRLVYPLLFCGKIFQKKENKFSKALILLF